MGVFCRRRELDGNLCANLSQRERRWIDFSEGDAFLFAERRRYLAAKSARPSQRVEDNAFHIWDQMREIFFRRQWLIVTMERMKIYRDFPERLHHSVPHWVETRNTVSHPHQT